MHVVTRPNLKLSAASFCLLAACLALAAGGCSRTEPPRFHANREGIGLTAFELDGKKYDPKAFEISGGEADAEAREFKQARIDGMKLLASVLEASFGTPDEPALLPEMRYHPENNPGGLDLAKIKMAAGPAKKDRKGLYREHCSHCHGISGDGAGPTAAFLNPYPRDYRKGIFKFKSTESGAKPTRDDLVKVLKQGIHGTAMPSFLLLPEPETEALVEYVRYLAVRGSVELALARELLSEGKLVDENEFQNDETKIAAATRQRLTEEFIRAELDSWAEAETKVVNPEPPAVPENESPADRETRLAAAREAGRVLFMDAKKGNCFSCHGPTGLGDGRPDKIFDVWNKFKFELPDSEAYWRLPIQELQPRNLRLGIYRGGRRPIDIYRRIKEGIQGTEMPKIVADVTNEQIWQIVEYVLSLPYEEATPAPTESENRTRGI